ncbi:motility associated factor glycosyltransferase family protein [Halalkalibacter sp. AB-rgal2]|uniref:motility associated factor glycosyltransferase family protein n=1 Tax=Halalkalibacter sp. AB-rgal2 TaxID=3242695 RepID=UPI00359CBFEC
MLVDNIQYLRKHYRYIRELIQKYEPQLKKEPMESIQSRKGYPTLQITTNERQTFLHSKYDPLNEANKWIEQYADQVDQYEHVLFYGIGFGYHIEEFMKRWPNKTFSLYEPSPAVFYHFMNQRKLTELPIQQMRHLFIEWTQESGSQFVQQFAREISKKVLLIPIPSYERIFPSQYEQFLTNYRDYVQLKSYSRNADYFFGKRWTVNSLMNVPTTLNTPNIFEKKDVFKGKPVLIVSAGPSLQDEYENLRYIKEKKLAYIIAVGSANKALIAQDIMPDAVCTYDPQPHNFTVFKPMYEKNISSVPMIYGTTVGFETLDYYRGPKLHFVTTQDAVTPAITRDESIPKIDDAFSIAIVTLQLMATLEAGSIILVGQNFAFRENLYYSNDINRGNESAELQEKDIKESLYVEDVHGGQVKTNSAFNQMRLSIESYIKRYANVNVTNTTKDGAKIEGAPFIPLEQVITEELTAAVVKEEWYVDENNDRYLTMKDSIQSMYQSIIQFMKDCSNVFAALENIEHSLNQKNRAKIELGFVEYDKAFKQFVSNQYGKVIIQPATRDVYKTFVDRLQEIKHIPDVFSKASSLLKESSLYMNACRLMFNELTPFVKKQLSEGQNETINYPSNCGVFRYSSRWERDYLTIIDVKNGKKATQLPIEQTAKTGETIKFNFKGTSLKVKACTREDYAASILIKIDGIEQTFSTRNQNIKQSYVCEHGEVVFTCEELEDHMHQVEIELLENKPFVFTGVEVGEGRVFHIDEVTDVESLEVGKRIRCHYKATYNKVGEFSNLGKAVGAFIPPESAAYPDGDFYFIMVDVEEGKKKLIADRNVQHSISWDSLEYFGVPKGKKLNLDREEAFIRLLLGGSAFKDHNSNKSFENQQLGAWPHTNEWDQFVNTEDFIIEGVASWCKDMAEIGMKNTWYIGNEFTTTIITEEKRQNGRILRGNFDHKYLLSLNRKLIRESEGFRPLILI